MTLHEILTAAGIEEAVATKVLEDMATNKIYTTGIENADVRYEKLKTKHDTLTGQLTDANAAIEGFKNQNPEQLQADYEKLKGDYELLQTESAKKLKDFAVNHEIKAQLKANKAKEKYADLLAGKIDKESLQLAEDGTVTGLEELFGNLRSEYSDLFEAEQPQLGGTPPNNSGNSGAENSTLVDQIRQSISRS